MATFFCPGCWKEIKATLQVCPFCGFVLAAYDQLSFEQKLLTALEHPVFERRMMAVNILGTLGSVNALPHFQDILNRPTTDYYLARSILEAVDKINHPDSAVIIKKATHHHIELMRELAEYLLTKRTNSCCE